MSTKVQETADDAAISKNSAANAGYYRDPFIQFFIQKTNRRSPLINRGYFARALAVDVLIRRFITICRQSGDGRSQVVVLGAGMDSLFWRLYCDAALVVGGSEASGEGMPSLWVEVDFPDVTSRKATVMKSVPTMSRCVAGLPVKAVELEALEKGGKTSSSPYATGAVSASSPSTSGESSIPPERLTFTPTPEGGCSVSGASGYRLVTGDLRDLEALKTSLSSAGVDPSIPTLFLSECVLVYLEPEDSCAVIAWSAATFKRAAFVSYEQIRPHDAFGQVMCRSLEERGYKLRGLPFFPDINSQIARYRELGYSSGVSVYDMNDIYYKILPRSEVLRVEKIEIFDEFEEWHLMSAHYCIAVAVKEDKPDGISPSEDSMIVSGRLDEGEKASKESGSGGKFRSDAIEQSVAEIVHARHTWEDSGIGSFGSKKIDGTDSTSTSSGGGADTTKSHKGSVLYLPLTTLGVQRKFTLHDMLFPPQETKRD